MPDQLDSRAGPLEAFLRQAGDDVRVVGWDPLSGGRSADTARLTLREADRDVDYVLHIESDQGPLTSMTSMDRQWSLLRAVASTAVPAPRARWYCGDGRVLGRPFIVTEFLPGAVPNPWRPEGRDELERQAEGGELAESFVQTLADIHRIPTETLPANAGGGDPDAARSHATRDVERWSAVVAGSSVFRHDPLLAYAEGFLRRYPSVSGPPGIVHGDYRPGNLVIADRRVVGVLDWELAEVGDPVYDLGIVCSPPLRTAGLAVGMWEPGAFVRRYEEIVGWAVDREAVHYYEVMSAYRVVVLWVNASRSFTGGVDDLTSLRAGASVLQSRPMLAQALGMSIPQVDAGDGVAVRSARTVQRALRESVLPAARGEARDVLFEALAVLRAEGGHADSAVREELAAAVDELWCEAAAALPVLRRVEPAREDRLAAVARAVQADPDLAEDIEAPLHARTRALVARAATPQLGRWP